VARPVPKRYSPALGLWPTEHLPTRTAEARADIEKKRANKRAQADPT
jgi:hypothetical protein